MAVAMCAAGLTLALLFAQTTLFQRLNAWLHDAEQRAFGQPIPLGGVVVFDVDDESLGRLAGRLGAWPYDYDAFAEVARYLASHGGRMVAFNVLFGDERHGVAALARTLHPNTALAAAGLPIALPTTATGIEQLSRSAVAFDAGEWDASSPPLQLSGQTSVHQRPFPHHYWPTLKMPLEPLTSLAAPRVGVMNLQPDEDGVLRRAALFHSSQGAVLPSLPVAALLAADPAPAEIRYESSILWGGHFHLRRLTVPVTGEGDALLRFPSNHGSLRVIPFYELLAAATGGIASDWLAREVAGKDVFIGSSSALGGDYAYTPVGRMSGLELTALAYATLASGHVITPSRWWLDGALLLAALALPLALALPKRRTSGRYFAAALVTLTFALGAIGSGLAMAGMQSNWLLAFVAGTTSLLIVFSEWLFKVSDEQRRLRYETLAAKETTRLKSEFLNHLTHELRTPLTAIMGFNKLIQFTDDLGREARIRHSAVIGRNCEHLLQLINNQLDLARLEAGTVAIVSSPEDPDQLCRDVVERMQAFADEKRVRLKFSRATPLPQTLALDAFRVRQILINLLGNALKFTQAGSVELVASWHLAALVLEVRDTGPGIADEAMARIFEPYQQANATIAQRFGGTGLGLAITRQLVHLMNGRIEVESKPGLGSTFRVRIPSEPVASKDPTVPVAAVHTLREPLAGRVLLAEDNEDIRALVVLYLGRLGIDVVAVANGFSAVEHALSQRFDVVLMDMEMPVMNGYEAVNVLRTRDYAGVILALTAHHEGAEIERALAAGCDGVVSKPVSLESLREGLRPVLRETHRTASHR